MMRLRKLAWGSRCSEGTGKELRRKRQNLGQTLLGDWRLLDMVWKSETRWILTFSESLAWLGHKHCNHMRPKGKHRCFLPKLSLVSSWRWGGVQFWLVLFWKKNTSFFFFFGWCKRKTLNHYKPYYKAHLIFLSLSGNKTMDKIFNFFVFLNKKSLFFIAVCTLFFCLSLCSLQMSRECKCAWTSLSMRENKSIELLFHPVFYTVMLSWPLTIANK